jgi:hypothetical protein
LGGLAIKSDIGSIANALAEASKVVGAWLASRQRRRMRAAIDAAERYIFVSERAGEYAELSDEKRARYLKHFRKRFFRFNQ